jgi:hypothetical protein
MPSSHALEKYSSLTRKPEDNFLGYVYSLIPLGTENLIPADITLSMITSLTDLPIYILVLP